MKTIGGLNVVKRKVKREGDEKRPHKQGTNLHLDYKVLHKNPYMTINGSNRHNETVVD
jgi:hypothetical protein